MQHHYCRPDPVARVLFHRFLAVNPDIKEKWMALDVLAHYASMKFEWQEDDGTTESMDDSVEYDLE